MRDVQIGGVVPFTTIDYPGKLACVLFLVGCPLRCAYCSNPHLLCVGDGEYDPELILGWLEKRVGKLEAVVFSGGEALMQGDATIEYIKRVRNMGFKVGLHTNGFYPDVLQKVAEFIDWIGLDFKATHEKYHDLTGQEIAFDNMIRSLDVWQATGKDFEVRITCDPRFIDKCDLVTIVNYLAARGVKNIAIQKYIPHHEAEPHKTNATERNQFFDDMDLRQKINAMAESVVWRE